MILMKYRGILDSRVLFTPAKAAIGGNDRVFLLHKSAKCYILN